MNKLNYIFVLMVSIYFYCGTLSLALTDLTLSGTTPYNVALGKTGVYGSNGIESIFENPAYVDHVHAYSSDFVNFKLPDQTDMYILGVKYNFEQGWTLGSAIARTAVSDIAHTGMDQNGDIIILDTFSFSQYKFKNVLAKAIDPRLQLGLGVSLESIKAGRYASGSGWICDVGLVYFIDDNIQLGLRADIFGNYYLFNVPFGVMTFQDGSSEDIPKKLNLGMKIRFISDVNIMLAGNYIDGQDLSPSLGVSYLAAKGLELRAGITQERTSMMTRSFCYSFGVGVGLGMLRIDYAFKQNPEFSDMNLQAFSIGLLN